MTKKKSPQESLYRRPIGIFEAKRSVRLLQKYYALMRLYNDLGSPEDIQKIYERYPKLKGAEKALIKSELNHLSVVVYHILERINAPLDWTFQTEEIDFDFNKGKDVSKTKTFHVNLVLDRFMPYYRERVNFIEAYEGLCGILEQSIAYYERVFRGYWRRLLNPVWWISTVLRIPISIIEYMGIDTSTHETNRFIYWLIQALVLVALSFLCLKIGLSPMDFMKIK